MNVPFFRYSNKIKKTKLIIKFISIILEISLENTWEIYQAVLVPALRRYEYGAGTSLHKKVGISVGWN